MIFSPDEFEVMPAAGDCFFHLKVLSIRCLRRRPLDMTSLNSLPADVIRAVISFVGRDAAIDGNFTIDSSLWNVARGWDEHIAEALDWSHIAISSRDYGAAGHVVKVVENDSMRNLASQAVDMGVKCASALPRAICEKVRRATFVFDESGRFRLSVSFPNLEFVDLASTQERELSPPFYRGRPSPMSDKFYEDVLPLLRGVKAIRDIKCYVTDCIALQPSDNVVSPGHGARQATREVLGNLSALARRRA